MTITYTDKTTGGQFTAANANEIKSEHNALVSTVGALTVSGGGSPGALYADAYGLDEGNTGAQNSTAMLAAWDAARALGGATIYIPQGDYQCNPTTFPRNASGDRIEIVGLSMAHFYPTTAGGPNDFMWDFVDPDNNLVNLTLRNIWVQGTSRNRTTNGIRIGRTNKLLLRNCHGKDLDGTCYHFKAPDNCDLEVYTYNSGNATRYAQYVVGRPAEAGETNDGEIPNDVRYAGATERDFRGLCVELCPMFRTTARFKVHGRPSGGAFRAVAIKQSNSIDCEFLMTLNWENDGFIYIGDGESVDNGGEPLHYPVARFTLAGTIGVIDLHNMYNNKRTTNASDLASQVRLDCGSSLTRLTIRGQLLSEGIENLAGNGPNVTGASYTIFGITNPATRGGGNPGYDFRDLKFGANIGTSVKIDNPANVSLTGGFVMAV